MILLMILLMIFNEFEIFSMIFNDFLMLPLLILVGFGKGSEGHSSLGAGDNEPICPDWLLGHWGQLPLAP